MKTRFDIGSGTAIVSGESVDEFHDEMKQAMLDGFLLYGPMLVSGSVPRPQVISQFVITGASVLSYMLIVAESLDMLGERVGQCLSDGWDLMFWHVQMDGKYLQWVCRPVDPKESIGKVLVDALKEAVNEFNELEKMHSIDAHWVQGSNVQPFPGVFVKSIQQMDLVERVR